METVVASCVRISLGLASVLGERCMRSATGHDELRAPAGGASVWLEAASTLYFSVGRRLCSDLVRGSQGYQPYGRASVLPFGPTSTLEARQPSDRSLLEPIGHSLPASSGSCIRTCDARCLHGLEACRQASLHQWLAFLHPRLRSRV